MKIKRSTEYEGIVRQLMTYMMEDSRTIPSVLTALFCARSIERIGDRCQNICYLLFRQRAGLPSFGRRRPEKLLFRAVKTKSRLTLSG